MNEETSVDFTKTVPESWRGESKYFRPKRKPTSNDWLPLAIGLGVGALILGVVALFDSGVAVYILISLVVGFVYLLPSIVARCQNHRNLVGVGLLNFFLGWTILGWVGALVWAVLEQERRKD